MPLLRKIGQTSVPAIWLNSRSFGHGLTRPQVERIRRGTGGKCAAIAVDDREGVISEEGRDTGLRLLFTIQCGNFSPSSAATVDRSWSIARKCSPITG
jgi:hypothetical protein